MNEYSILWSLHGVLFHNLKINICVDIDTSCALFPSISGCCLCLSLLLWWFLTFQRNVVHVDGDCKLAIFVSVFVCPLSSTKCIQSYRLSRPGIGINGYKIILDE